MPTEKLELISGRDIKIPAFLEDLLSCGWEFSQVPEDGKIPRNGIKIIFKTNGLEKKFRIFIYAAGESSRSRPHERRIEITTTYQSNLVSEPDFFDVVLGYERDSGKYIGVDPRRLFLGGPTHNASSFFDLEGLSVNVGELLINPRRTADLSVLGGTERHAFFDRSRISEYLFNFIEIHSEHYSYNGPFCGRAKTHNLKSPFLVSTQKFHGDTFIMQPNADLAMLFNIDIVDEVDIIAAIESNDMSQLSSRKITPWQLHMMQQKCIEIGNIGEQFVLKNERKRLRDKGMVEYANKIERISLKSVSEGYDILSFEHDAKHTPRHIEVKSSIGSGSIVDISRGEWKAAEKLREKYYIARVFNVKGNPYTRYYKDPFSLREKGDVSSEETGWKLDLSNAKFETS